MPKLVLILYVCSLVDMWKVYLNVYYEGWKDGVRGEELCFVIFTNAQCEIHTYVQTSSPVQPLQAVDDLNADL